MKVEKLPEVERGLRTRSKRVQRPRSTRLILRDDNSDSWRGHVAGFFAAGGNRQVAEFGNRIEEGVDARVEMFRRGRGVERLAFAVLVEARLDLGLGGVRHR